MPVLIVKKEMKKSNIKFFKDGGFDLDKTILKSKKNKGENFPNFDTDYEVQTVLSLVLNHTLIQARFKSTDLQPFKFMQETYSNLEKLVQAHNLNESLPTKDTHTKKMKI